MATLSDVCAILPTEWVEREEHKERNKQVELSKKLAWKFEKKANKDRMLAYREREHKRAMRRGGEGVSLDSDRRRVQRSTMPEPMHRENCAEMFYAGQGVRQPKKAKNKVSSEQAGTVGRRITVKRFDGSMLTCVCKSRIG